MKTKYFAVFLLSFLFFSQVAKTQSLLNIRISLNVQNATVGGILKDIEQQGNFFFAYNPDNINETRIVSLSASDKKVGDVLKELFQGQATFRQVENHVIISEFSKSNAKNTFKISGRIADYTDAPLDSVIVYDPENEKLVISHENGLFSFDFNSNDENISLFISRPSFNDTVIYIGSGQQDIYLKLYKRELSPFALIPKGGAETELKLKEKNFESLSLVQKFVSPEALYASRLNTEKIIPVQLSFLPKVGTNSFIRGLRVNNVSFNILAGYSKGLKGAEFGGIANIIQNEARGVQAGGIANIVLGDVYGVQFSGVFTNDFSNVDGFQVGGVYNILQGELSGGQIGGVANIALKNVVGTQVGGVFNIAKGSMDGAQAGGVYNILQGELSGGQIGGVANIALKNTTGTQVAGIVNIVKGEMSGAQLGGVLNINEGKINGAQIAGIANISGETARGVQIAGLYNGCSGINGLQLSGIVNLSRNNTQGTQITSILNRTKALHGLQFGLVNIADTISSGFQIGLVNIVRHGVYSLELSHNETFPVELNFKTGNPRIYSVINLATGNGKLGFGYGFGGNFPVVKKFAFSSEALCTSVYIPENMELQGQKITMRLALNYELVKHFRLAGGVSGNCFFPEKPSGSPSGGTIISGSSNHIEKAIQNGKNNFWVGWFLGVQISDVI